MLLKTALKNAIRDAILEFTCLFYRIKIFHPSNTQEHEPTPVAWIALKQQAAWCWVEVSCQQKERYPTWVWALDPQNSTSSSYQLRYNDNIPMLLTVALKFSIKIIQTGNLKSRTNQNVQREKLCKPNDCSRSAESVQLKLCRKHTFTLRTSKLVREQLKTT